MMDVTRIRMLSVLATLLLIFVVVQSFMATKRYHDEGSDAGRLYSIISSVLGVVATSLILVTAFR